MSYDTIRAVGGYDEGAYTYYPVVIIGAGESGIALGCQLKEKLGLDQFRIFDRQSGPGGTWWINRYPGVACDVPTFFYSFSFMPFYDAKELYPTGSDIIKYLQRVCDRYEITDKIQVDTEVANLKWLEEEQLWQGQLVYMAPGLGDLSVKDRQKFIREKGRDAAYLKVETFRAKIVCSCVGGLVEPNAWPSYVPGIESFEGKVFHSSRWDHSVDFNDKDVVVIGTGCSSVQFVPKLGKPPYNAKSVTQLMRSPPWVVPKIKEPGGREYYREKGHNIMGWPGVGRFVRTSVFLMAEVDFQRLFLENSFFPTGRATREAAMIKHMKTQVPEKYHEKMTPDYGIGCKRIIFDYEWLKSMNEPSFTLETRPLRSVQPRSVTVGPGREYPDPQKSDSKAPTEEAQIPADIIVMANGFDTTTWLHSLDVVGRHGKTLHDTWDERGGASAYNGMAVKGFPNFFIIFGPNTATGHSSVILATENMVQGSLNFISPILKNQATTIEITKDADDRWARDIQNELKQTVWMSSGCRSWYKTASGWNSTVYPRSQFDFWYRCLFPKWSDWNVRYTRKGLLVLWWTRLLKTSALAAVIYGTYWKRKNSIPLAELSRMLWARLAGFVKWKA